jgi:hypothetical protein
VNFFAKLNNLTKSKTVYGLHAFINADNTIAFALVKLTKEAKVSKIEEYGIQLSLEAIKELIKTNLPIALVITGKGITTKKVNSKSSESPETLLNKALPNAKIVDFIIEYSEIDEEHSIVSIIRKDTLTNVLETITTLGISNLFAINIGTIVLNTIVPHINSYQNDNEFVLQNTIYQVKNNAIFSITTSLNPTLNKLKIAEDELFDYSVLPLSACLGYYLNNNFTNTNSDFILNLNSEFKQKEKFVVRLWSTLAFSLLILLVNFFVFNFYWQKNLAMNNSISGKETTLNKLAELKLEYANKMEFVNSNGLLETSKTSFYADRLSEGLLENINFTNLIIYPAKEKKDGYEIEIPEFESKKINVKGNCEKSIELNFWMKKIQKFSWIKSVQLINYTQENSSNKAKFYLEINIK